MQIMATICTGQEVCSSDFFFELILLPPCQCHQKGLELASSYSLSPAGPRWRDGTWPRGVAEPTCYWLQVTTVLPCAAGPFTHAMQRV